MILAHGRIFENKEQEKIISCLQDDICQTLQASKITTEDVIGACDALSKRAINGEFDEIAKPLMEMMRISRETFLRYCKMFSAEELRKKTETELCGLTEKETQISEHLFRVREPLGVLLHIAAGNVDVLPAYSVIEGLLAGNINILKLPTGDSGVSVKLLSELIGECPRLKDHIYVFDVPSTELDTIKTLAELSDGVVVWGGDEAVRAAHRFVSPNTRLIPWGHKLSFAYATENTPDDLLYALALDICKTNQMLCSSCQGIYLDTEYPAKLQAFGKRFFELLKKANTAMGKAPAGMRAKNTLKLYTDKLENKNSLLMGDGISVVIKEDAELELSYLFRNVWIKALPRERIVPVLKHQKGYLQSCALLLPEGEEKESILPHLIKAGLTRITDPAPSELRIGEAHDGMLPLMEYSRIVDIYR